MNKITRSVWFGLGIVATLSIAGSSFAEGGASYVAEQKILHQALSDLRSAKAKLHRVGRDFGGHTRRAETLVEESMAAVDAAIEHAREHRDD